MTALQVPLYRLPHGRDLPLPAYASEGAAGLDLLAAISEAIQLAPGARRLIPTGLSIALPPGYEAQVRPRSGLALMHGVGLLNSPGTIDADYRGEIGVILINHGQSAFSLERGDRIAQLIVAAVARLAWVETDSLPESARAASGFGSTGKR